MTTTIFDYEVLFRTFGDQKYVLYPLLFLVLLVLFYTLYTIADRHLTWSLGHLSEYCRLSPSMAGITFLAFGNGAPDFFTSVFGAQEAPEMVLAGSLGSSLFIGVFVLGVALAFYKPPAKETKRPRLSPTPFLKNVFFYAVALAFLGYFIFRMRIHVLPLALMVGAFVLHLGWSIMQHQFKNSSILQTQTLPRETSMPKVIRELLQESAYDRLHSLPLYRRIPQAIVIVWKHDFCNAPWWDRISLICTSPFRLVHNLSILPLEPLEEDYERPTEVVAALRCLHRVRVVLNIFFSALLWKQAVFGGLRHWKLYEIIFYVLNGLFCAGLYAYFTYWRQRPKFYGLHVMNGFCACILWIFLASKELVTLIAAIGSFLNVDDAIMGSTILAWGNSFGDLVSIFALSRNGHLETAVTACFCGPVQNVLLTLAVALSISLFRSKNAAVAIKPELVHTSLFLAWSLCVALVVTMFSLTPTMFRYRLPRWLGFILMASYILTYIPFSIYSFLKAANSLS